MTWMLLGYICAFACCAGVLTTMLYFFWEDLNAGLSQLALAALLVAAAAAGGLVYLCYAGPVP